MICGGHWTRMLGDAIDTGVNGPEYCVMQMIGGHWARMLDDVVILGSLDKDAG